MKTAKTKQGEPVMRVNHKLLLAAALGIALPGLALAQDGAGSLAGASLAQLRGEIGQRYADALALSQDPAVVSADNPRFLWATQAKVQCGIALGFLKSGTRDPISIGKCDDALRRARQLPAPASIATPAPAPLPPAPSDACTQPIAGIVFFEWDDAAAPASAGQTLDAVVQSAASCGWQRLVVTGHADRSGSDTYNDALSVRRANNVASLLGAKGIDRSKLEVSGHGEAEPRVPTVDGERNPQNRRVEITVK
jgi:outer membrane protein OmpA-like peptidoglycan-associated protein